MKSWGWLQQFHRVRVALIHKKKCQQNQAPNDKKKFNVPTHLLFSNAPIDSIIISRLVSSSGQSLSRSQRRSQSVALWDPENRIGPEFGQQRGSSTGADSTRCTRVGTDLENTRDQKPFGIVSAHKMH
jgi:hypothetical protein